MISLKTAVSFFRSHRRKIAIFALLGTALYSAYRLRKAYNNLRLQLDATSSERLSTLHKKFETCQRTIVLTTYSFLPLLKSRLWELTQVENTVRQLKASEAQTEHRKQDLWEKLKIETFTRVICGAYALSLLFVVVTLKVSLLGRYLTEELRVPFTEVPSSELAEDELGKLFQELRNLQSNLSIHKGTQQAYLDITCTCLDSFLDILVGRVKTSVEKVLVHTRVTQTVDTDFWNSAVVAIREDIETVVPDVENSYSFAAFPPLMAEQELRTVETGTLETKGVNRDSLIALLNETADIIEEADFREVLTEVVEIVFEILRKQVSSFTEASTKITSAQLLPKIQSVVSQVFLDSTSNSYIHAISELDCVENFAAVIFLSGEKYEPSEG
ncbi:peroxin-3 family protein [Galdieria sulphuraria]|uniref:Peroxin-3 family protein n=1 Tax=Galdieria sulphuraria TaxID=130081 RepID=M2Y9B0_GALSU|nr:peroxin-3 family protein [Galdieria sulphuraria]EME32678.1 peroxin-3 family protein [Galdieria sulphuraria]|eukprot:XP_005709198.1 peroxin-3 family protein [Galdieria sulphuraria]